MARKLRRSSSKRNVGGGNGCSLIRMSFGWEEVSSRDVISSCVVSACKL